MRIPPNRRGDGTFGVEGSEASKVEKTIEARPRKTPKTAFKKGREKTGGRQKGTPNKRTTVEEALAALNFDHIEELVNTARTTNNEVLKAQICLGFLKFTHAQKRDDTVRVSGLENLAEQIREGHRRAAEAAVEQVKKEPA
jgi:hypothetical protein